MADKTEKLSALIAWLRAQVAERRASAKSRKDEADCSRDKSAAQLRADKRAAEQMFGRKLDLVKTTVAANRQHVQMQERIAAKLEIEAQQLMEWVAMLESELPTDGR